jgi:hypothetical protein
MKRINVRVLPTMLESMTMISLVEMMDDIIYNYQNVGLLHFPWHEDYTQPMLPLLCEKTFLTNLLHRFKDWLISQRRYMASFKADCRKI